MYYFVICYYIIYNKVNLVHHTGVNVKAGPHDAVKVKSNVGFSFISGKGLGPIKPTPVKEAFGWGKVTSDGDKRGLGWEEEASSEQENPRAREDGMPKGQ